MKKYGQRVGDRNISSWKKNMGEGQVTGIFHHGKLLLNVMWWGCLIMSTQSIWIEAMRVNYAWDWPISREDIMSMQKLILCAVICSIGYVAENLIMRKYEKKHNIICCYSYYTVYTT